MSNATAPRRRAAMSLSRRDGAGPTSAAGAIEDQTTRPVTSSPA